MAAVHSADFSKRNNEEPGSANGGEQRENWRNGCFRSKSLGRIVTQPRRTNEPVLSPANRDNERETVTVGQVDRANERKEEKVKNTKANTEGEKGSRMNEFERKPEPVIRIKKVGRERKKIYETKKREETSPGSGFERRDEGTIRGRRIVVVSRGRKAKAIKIVTWLWDKKVEQNEGRKVITVVTACHGSATISRGACAGFWGN